MIVYLVRLGNYSRKFFHSEYLHDSRQQSATMKPPKIIDEQTNKEKFTFCHIDKIELRNTNMRWRKEYLRNINQEG